MSLPVFKTGAPGNPRWAGSIPVRLRQKAAPADPPEGASDDRPAPGSGAICTCPHGRDWSRLGAVGLRSHRWTWRCAVNQPAGSAIGARLRAARARAGISREALAFHSGLSWSAVASVESGRRKNIRPDTLLALSRALGVTTDYLVGAPGMPPPSLLTHAVFLYEEADDLLSGLVPFLEEGIERSEAVLAVTSAPNIEVLKAALGPRASEIQFREAAEWYRTPRDALNAYRDFVGDEIAAGHPWIRIVGEPLWEGVPAGDARIWERYESMINLVLSSFPVTIYCPYNAASGEKGVVSGAKRTHPEILLDGELDTNDHFEAPEITILGP